MNAILMQAIIDGAMFAALSDDNVINPDAAVKYLEHLAATLQSLGQEERDEFRRFVGGLAEKEPDSLRREFLADLCEDLGL